MVLVPILSRTEWLDGKKKADGEFDAGWSQRAERRAKLGSRWTGTSGVSRAGYGLAGGGVFGTNS